MKMLMISLPYYEGISLIIMDTLAQLERFSNDLAIAVKDLATHSQIASTQYDLNGAPRANLALDTFATTNEEVELATTRILSSATKIRALVQGPTEFLKQLATQVCTLSIRVLAVDFDFLRVKSWHAYDGLANSRFWLAFPWTEAFLSQMWQNYQAFQKDC